MDLFEVLLQSPPSSTCFVGKKRNRDSDLQDFEDIFESTAKKTSFPRNHTSDDEVLEELSVQALAPPLPSSFPFHHYIDYSNEKDPDPLTPLTPPGRVPNFPAKMQAILSRPDLAGIVSWMPHGRSWRVLKPREFEVRVIPTYFEHTKFSSFIRQANGWGFRRITQGKDRNTYYHPRFLRGLPYLCKNMKRPGVAEKQTADPEHEPDLNMISEMHPLPEKAEDESIMLECILKGGPKARMPIYTGTTSTAQFSCGTSQLSPSEQQAVAAFQLSLGASESQLTRPSSKQTTAVKTPEATSRLPLTASDSKFVPHSFCSLPHHFGSDESPGASPLALAHQMAFSEPTAMPSNNAAAHFAAGFAAASALSRKQFQTMLETLQLQGLVQIKNNGASI